MILLQKNFLKQHELMLKYHTIDDYEKYNYRQKPEFTEKETRSITAQSLQCTIHTIQSKQFKIAITQTFPDRFQIFKLMRPQILLRNVYIPPQLTRLLPKTYNSLQMPKQNIQIFL